MRRNPLNGSVPPHIEITFVPTRAAICIFEESIAIIRSSLLIKCKFFIKIKFPGKIYRTRYSLSEKQPVFSESSIPPKSQNLHLCFSDISLRSLTIFSSGHIFSLCFAYGATPIFNSTSGYQSLILLLLMPRAKE